jgi:hypothetical protein
MLRNYFYSIGYNIFAGYSLIDALQYKKDKE